MDTPMEVDTGTDMAIPTMDMVPISAMVIHFTGMDMGTGILIMGMGMVGIKAIMERAIWVLMVRVVRRR